MCGLVGADVDLSLDMRMKKGLFSKNNPIFTHLLGFQMEYMDCITVNHSQGDTDYDIVKSACDIAKDRHVILVEDDTDLHVLLLQHFSSDNHQNIYLKTSSKLIDICHL